MKFLMVMIICFAQDTCTAIFDTAEYNTYNECMVQAMPLSKYMMEVYQNTAGEIHCLDEDEYSQYKSYIDNGGRPELSFSIDPSSDA